jgi:hypothetical protein
MRREELEVPHKQVDGDLENSSFAVEVETLHILRRRAIEHFELGAGRKKLVNRLMNRKRLKISILIKLAEGPVALMDGLRATTDSRIGTYEVAFTLGSTSSVVLMRPGWLQHRTLFFQ